MNVNRKCKESMPMQHVSFLMLCADEAAGAAAIAAASTAFHVLAKHFNSMRERNH